MEWDDHLERIHSNGSHRRQTSLGHDLVIRMNLDEAIKALGPRPQPRRGIPPTAEARDWWVRYLALFPDGPVYLKRRAKESTDAA